MKLKSKTNLIIVCIVLFLALSFIGAWYGSIESQIERNGFRLINNSTSPNYYKSQGFASENLSLTSLQIYAKNMGVQTIYNNHYYVSDSITTVSYYFIDDSTVYYHQFQVVESPRIDYDYLLYPLLFVIVGSVIIFTVIYYRVNKATIEEEKA